MGHTTIDVHKREKRLDAQYPLGTVRGVLKFLDHIHHIRAERSRGSIDASVLLVDFVKAFTQAALTLRERQVLYWRFERDMTLEDTAQRLKITIPTVDETCRRAARKLAHHFGQSEGYAYVRR